MYAPRVQVMRWLADECGADVGACNVHGCSAVMWCAQGVSGEDAMELLRTRGAAFAAVFLLLGFPKYGGNQSDICAE